MTEEPAASSSAPSDYGVWLAAYTVAQTPPPKAAEMAAALDHMLVYEHGNMSATAAVNGGVYDPERMRRLVAIEAAQQMIQRISAKWADLPDWMKALVLGKPSKRPDG